MNSLNILSGRVSPVQTSSPSRTNSYGNVLTSVTTDAECDTQEQTLDEKKDGYYDEDISTYKQGEHGLSEKRPLLGHQQPDSPEKEAAGWSMLPKRIASTFIDSLRWLLTTVASPGIYLVSLLYNEDGVFLPFSVFYRQPVSTATGNSPRKTSKRTETGSVKVSRKDSVGRRLSTREVRTFTSNSSSSGMSSESEQELGESTKSKSGRVSRTKASHLADEISPARRSIRIKLHNEDSLRQRTRRKSQSVESNSTNPTVVGKITPATLKSPTSPPSSLSMTRYPRAPAPPRPIIPRRQPSFTLQDSLNMRGGQKTLVLDLDETLIHSMAKGGRMGTGHMVEVKLNTMVGTGSNATPGPQHPILYYVHKRPHCDEFLRKVSRKVGFKSSITDWVRYASGITWSSSLLQYRSMPTQS